MNIIIVCISRFRYRNQIEAADKKLRCTTQFLEEQAVERELERDEAQKEIAALREQLREVERTRVSCEQINTEVRLSSTTTYYTHAMSYLFYFFIFLKVILSHLPLNLLNITFLK